MRVICVTPITVIHENAIEWPRPEVGDQDIVIREKVIDNTLYYALQRFGRRNGFKASHFATLLDATADEMEAETKEAIVPCPAY